MEKTFTTIQNYILFLRQQGFNISFSDFADRFYPFTQNLLQHEIHLHSVCSYLKSNPKTAGMCVQNKAKLKNCKIRHCAYSCCYAGVEEYIYPIYHKNERIIIIHISGYRDNLSRSKRLKNIISQECEPIFLELYSQLSKNPPTKNTLDSFIKPLEYMLVSLYEKSLSQQNKLTAPTITNEIYINALQFINDNYMNDISAKVIAQRLGYSASYIRAVFKRESGCSLQNKINETRLNNAKFLLKNTKMSVTDISFQCGFSDSNYFSVTFKKAFSVSPLQFRNSREE